MIIYLCGKDRKSVLRFAKKCDFKLTKRGKPTTLGDDRKLYEVTVPLNSEVTLQPDGTVTLFNEYLGRWSIALIMPYYVQATIVSVA